MLEDRRLLAADMLFAGEVLNQELDAPSDHLSTPELTAAAESAGSEVVAIGVDAPTGGADLFAHRSDKASPKFSTGVETPVDVAAADQVFELSGRTIVLDDDSVEIYDIGDVNRDGVDAAAYTVGRDDLGATTVASPSDALDEDSGAAEMSIDAPTAGTDVFAHRSDKASPKFSVGVETPVDAAIADHESQPLADTSFADETHLDADVVDQVFTLDDVAAPGDLGMNSLSGTLEVSREVFDQVHDMVMNSPSGTLEGDTGDASSDTQPSFDIGMDGSPGGLVDSEPGAEPTRPDETGIQFGLAELIWDCIVWFANRKG